MIINSRTMNPDTVETERNRIVQELLQWLPIEEKLDVMLMPKKDLILLHRSLGQAIRNEFELWSDDHPVTKMWKGDGPLLEDGCDVHPCHPDQFSFSCIEALWLKLQASK